MGGTGLEPVTSCVSSRPRAFLIPCLQRAYCSQGKDLGAVFELAKNWSLSCFELKLPQNCHKRIRHITK